MYRESPFCFADQRLTSETDLDFSFYSSRINLPASAFSAKYSTPLMRAFNDPRPPFRGVNVSLDERKTKKTEKKKKTKKKNRHIK